MKKILIIIGMLFLTGCSSSSNDVYQIEMLTSISDEPIIIELYEEVAPDTVNNFVSLAEDNFFDDLVFHRVVEDFVIQGGGFTEDGTHKETDPIKGEFTLNGITNDFKHERGVISMARTDDKNSASSQFFICLTTEKCSQLDNSYAAFGKVISGLEVVDLIGDLEVIEGTDEPEEKVKIISTKVTLIEEKEE